ncbi:MAG: hypothetical protein FVQ80_11500 [Planctomycetes bacterium]|nr:hypothetical protein [Planctomycetota bacterium]
MAQTIDCTFAGFHVESGEFSIVQGIAPGSGTLTFSDTSLAIPKTGTLIIADGLNTSCQINNIYAVNPRIEEDAVSGKQLVVTIYDRRWAWKHSWVVLRANTPDETGAPKQVKNLSALIAFLMTHLNESLYVMSSIPTVYPEVNWEFENPAIALQELLDKYGLVVGFDPSNFSGRITVGPKNGLRSMPGGDYSIKTLSNSNDIYPTNLILSGNRKINQKTFLGLIPVGEDTDGKIKPITSLSYAPADWGKELIACFTNLSTLQQRELAEKCIFKWYQINWATYTRAEVLPLLNEISALTTVDGNTEHDKPYILAEKTTWDGTEFKNIAKAVINEGYSIDKKTGIVKFTNQKVKATTEGAVATDFSAPDMDLVAAYEEKAGGDETDFIYWTRALAGGTITLPATYIDSSITGYYIAGVLQNSAALDAYANARLDELDDLYIATLPEIRVYPGTWNGGAYGRIRLINLSVDAQGGGEVEVQLSVEAPKVDMNTYKEVFQQQLVEQNLQRKAEDKQTADDRRSELGVKKGRRDIGENTDAQPLTWLGKTTKSIAKVKNVSGLLIPAKSVCVVTSYNTTDKLWEINRKSASTPPSQPVVVVQEAIPIGANGLAFWDGLHVVLKNAGYTATVGDIVSPKTGNFDVEKDAAGELVVVKINVNDLYVKPVRGTSVRKVFVKTTPTTTKTVVCWLSDTDGVGDTITVYCEISESGTALNAAIPTLKDGMWFYAKYNTTSGNWEALFPFTKMIIC